MTKPMMAITAGLLFTLAGMILLSQYQHGAAAAGQAGAGGQGTVAGVLMDKACSAENNTTAKALKHGKDCAQMEDCAKSGYGVVTADGKFLAFDAAGNEQAAAFLKQYKGSSAIKVKVEGTVEGSTLKVTSIKAG